MTPKLAGKYDAGTLLRLNYKQSGLLVNQLCINYRLRLKESWLLELSKVT